MARRRSVARRAKVSVCRPIEGLREDRILQVLIVPPYGSEDDGAGEDGEGAVQVRNVQPVVLVLLVLRLLTRVLHAPARLERRATQRHASVLEPVPQRTHELRNATFFGLGPRVMLHGTARKRRVHSEGVWLRRRRSSDQAGAPCATDRCRGQ